MSCHSRWNGIQLSEIVSWCDVLKSVQEVLRGTGKFILFRIVYSLGDWGISEWKAEWLVTWKYSCTYLSKDCLSGHVTKHCKAQQLVYIKKYRPIIRLDDSPNSLTFDWLQKNYLFFDLTNAGLYNWPTNYPSYLMPNWPRNSLSNQLAV